MANLKNYEYFKTNRGILYCGDCFEIIKLLNQSADLILTDPPYNISQRKKIDRTKINCKSLKRNGKVKDINFNFGTWDFFSKEEYLKFIEEWSKLIVEKSKETSSLYLWSPKGEVSLLENILSKNFWIRSTLVWCKTNPVPQAFKVGYMSSTEFCIFATKNRGRKHFWDIKRGQRLSYWIKPICQGKERTSHPTQKRLDIIQDMILQSSCENELVLDTFAGSGTTGVACEKQNRRYILIEKEEKYCAIAKERIENEIKQMKFNKF